jgi:uncharacterized phage protein (TIGR02218 family)
MKDISVALAAHYASGTTTLARLWRITRTDAQVYGFTDHDQAIVYGGVAFEPSSAFNPSAVATRGDGNVDNLEVLGLLDSAGITAEDIEAGLWDGSAVELLEVNWADLTMGHNTLRAGTTGTIQRTGARYVAELRGLMQALQNNVGRIVTPLCDAELGDARCGVDTSAWEVTGEVTAVASRVEFTTDADLSGPYERGTVEFTTGLNAGLRSDIRMVVESDGIVRLQLPTHYDLTVGDELTLRAGCPKTKDACLGTFDNLLNFRGFSFVPGQDAALEIGGQ